MILQQNLEKVIKASKAYSVVVPIFTWDNGLNVEFKSRYPKQKDEKLGEKVGESSPKSSPKTEEKIMDMIGQDNTITTEQMAEALNISKRAILKQISKLKDMGLLQRHGIASKSGWGKGWTLDGKMKITKIDTQVKYIELKTPFKTALRTATHVEFVRVCVECDNGLVGIGEAPATKAITGEGIEDILNSIGSVKKLFLGLLPKEALVKLHAAQIGSSAKAALDIAFVHLLSQEAKKPLYDYFGATDLTPLQTDVTISLNEAGVMLQDAKKAFDEGMEILKVKVGGDIEHALKVVKEIADALPSAKILVDANQAWSLENSLFFIQNIKGTQIELIEQPVIASDLDGLKKITEASYIPILADEAAFTLEDVKKVLKSKSADMINIKFMKCGGVSKAIEILEYAREKKVSCMLGSMLEGPYSINMALHLAFAYRDVIKYIDLDSPLLYKTMPHELDFEFRGCKIVLVS